MLLQAEAPRELGAVAVHRSPGRARAVAGELFQRGLGATSCGSTAGVEVGASERAGVVHGAGAQDACELGAAVRVSTGTSGAGDWTPALSAGGLGAVAVHLVEVGHVAGMLLERRPRRRGLVEPPSTRSVEMDAREAAIALASFMAPEHTALLAGRGAAPRLAGNEIRGHELGGPPSSTPGERDAIAEIEADVGERCAVGLVHRAARGAVPAP